MTQFCAHFRNIFDTLKARDICKEHANYRWIASWNGNLSEQPGCSVSSGSIVVQPEITQWFLRHFLRYIYIYIYPYIQAPIHCSTNYAHMIQRTYLQGHRVACLVHICALYKVDLWELFLFVASLPPFCVANNTVIYKVYYFNRGSVATDYSNNISDRKVRGFCFKEEVLRLMLEYLFSIASIYIDIL